jgi:cholest-4-en-3-one 26-monooxygenase
VFSSAKRLALFDELAQQLIPRERLMIINMDPPEHTRQRHFVTPMFSPRIVHRLEVRVREICRGLVDAAVQAGGAEFVSDIAAPLPVYVLGDMMGVPPEDRDWLLDLAGRLTRRSETAATQLYLYMSDLAEQRRADPRDDIVTMLLEPDQQGRSLSTDEFLMFALMLLIAGTETTTHAAAGGLLALLTHPEQWRRLQGHPELIPSAAEEIVRWTSPVNLFRRTATCDAEVGGRAIAEGDKLVLFYSSANRDSDIFDDPSSFDIGRHPNHHLGFGGGGPHFCLGRPLALLQLQVLLTELLERAPGISIDGQVRRLRSSFINGLTQLPVRMG